MRTKGLAAAIALALILAPVAAEAKITKTGARCYSTNTQVKTDNGFLKCMKTAGSAYRVWTAVTANGQVVRASVATPVKVASDFVASAPAAETAPSQPIVSQTVVAETVATPAASADASPAPVLVSSVEPAAPTTDIPTVAIDPVPLGIEVPAPTVGPSGYQIVTDPNNGGSNEVIYPDPADSEQANPALPVAVTGLTVTNLAETSLDVTFNPIPGVDVYSVYLRYGDSFTAKGTDGVNNTVHFDQLSPGWDYVTCVYYRQNNVESEKSCQSIHTLGVTPHAYNYLPGPTGVSAVAVDNTIEVSWDELANAVSYGVCIYSHDACQCGGYRELDSPRHIRFNDGSVAYAGSRYEVRVYAILTTGEMTVESKAYVVANGSPPPPPVLTSGVTNLRVTDVTPTTVTLAWDLPTDHTVNVWQVVSRYNTSYQANGVNGSDTGMTVTGLNPGFGYELYVEGFDGANWTVRASTSVILPAQP